jgi:flagellar hook-basal body complex protein FliE
MTITATVGQALSAYGAALKRAQAGPGAAPSGEAPAPRFESLLRAEVDATRTSLRASEAKAIEALSGGPASLQEVVEAVTEAELSLQKMTAVRDRVISAYQEIIRMPI